MELKTIATFDTVYSADSIEWHPSSEFSQHFVCGTYQLEEKLLNNDEPQTLSEEEHQVTSKTNRKGRIYLFTYDFEAKELTKVDQVETNAVLDQKWAPGGNLLGVADSKGFVTFYEVSTDDSLKETSQLEIIESNDDQKEILALSLDWNTEATQLVVSNSHGGFSVHQSQTGGFEKIYSANPHSFEAWIAVFDKNQPNIVYTGGDDTVLACYDLRTPPDPDLLWKSRVHDAGVTSLLSMPGKEHVLISGSYDEHLRVLDLRNPKRAVKESLNLGGGIWRIKQHPHRSDLLLTANMYHNFAIVSYGAADSSLTQEAQYFEHKSICYGCDWAPNDRDFLTFASCSFYDHRLSIVEVENKSGDG